jgi:ectoine hydroxylase-related dioxygenase (phytanoyl-CoA dioxygenase family)
VPSADAELPADDSDLTWWPMRPGDAVVMHSHVLHCTPANRNEEDERVSILTRWLSDDAVWHRDAFSTPVPGIPEAAWQPGAPAPHSFLT